MKSVKKKLNYWSPLWNDYNYLHVFAKASEFTIWVNSHMTKLIKIELKTLEHCTF